MVKDYTYVVKYETEIAGEFCDEHEAFFTVEVELNLRQLTSMVNLMHPNLDVTVLEHELMTSC